MSAFVQFLPKKMHLADVAWSEARQREWRDALGTLKRTNANISVPVVSFSQFVGIARIDDAIKPLIIGLRGIGAFLETAAGLKLRILRVNWTILIYLGEV